MRTAIAKRITLVLVAFGWRGVLRRGWYVARLRSGWFRWRLPTRDSFANEPRITWSFRIDARQVRARYEAAGTLQDARFRATAEADRLLAGDCRVFGGLDISPGWPPRWHQDPLTGRPYPASHWTEISDRDPARGDIKDVWELSRFGCTFVLARAYVLTGDPRYVEAWWAAVEDWATNNPPNRGVNWRCAQESSLRAITWCFGWSVFANDPASTEARTTLLECLLGATARRVRPTLGYALSQRNNHAISELTFLLSLPGRGTRRAQRLLREVLADQFFDDGSYAQQSLVYQRLAVHALAWLLLVADELPRPLAVEIRQCLARSAHLLDRCSDPVSGQLMNYGANDGSLLFAIGHSNPLDVRPTLALLERPSAAGQIEELAFWLSVDLGEATACESTYITMCSERTALLTRVGTVARRAGDADQQAVELLVDGHRVVLDPGTYRYNAPAPWRNPFVWSSVHSMATTASTSVASVGRFLHAPMSPAEILARHRDDDSDVVLSRRVEDGVELRRSIVRVGACYAVVDEARGSSGTVRWNLAPMDLTRDVDSGLIGRGPATVVFDPGAGARVLSRDLCKPGSGWWSPTYGVLEPSVVVEIDIAPDTPVMARFSPVHDELLSRDEVVARLAALEMA